MRCRLASVLVFAACTSSSGQDLDAAAIPDAAPEPPSGPGIVITDRGAVRGAREGDVLAWHGIPYAAAPIGDLRWRVPQPMPAWSGVRDAISWGQSCTAISTAGALLGGGEDCLYLNVWAPAEVTGPLPVLVFIHGGFALTGSSSEVASGERVYDGAYVAGHGPAVFVSLNYRLGALGFFTADALADESADHASGNYALHDQIAALRWVQTNIAAFGGDPDHVLVFGESAGGASTCALYASPRTTGLFSAAMIESAGCGARSTARAAALSAAFVDNAGCDGATDELACLRGLPADAVAVAAPIDLTENSDRWGISIDGDVVPVVPLDAIAADQQQDVPLVIGSTANEFSTLIGHFLAAPITTDAEYRATVLRFFPLGTDAILARYPSASFDSPLQALIALMTDSQMTCPTRRIARTAAVHAQPVRRYLFAHTYSNGPLQRFGAGHALDVPFELHNLALAGFTPTASELALSDAIVDYWVRFAATGDPNGDGAVAWPAHLAPADPILVLDDTITTTDGMPSAQCEFWDGLL